jgi:hypothetical protein
MWRGSIIKMRPIRERNARCHCAAVCEFFTAKIRSCRSSTSRIYTLCIETSFGGLLSG